MITILPEEFDLNKIVNLKDYAKDVLCKPALVYEEQARINPKRTTKLVEIENLCSIETPRRLSYWETHPTCLEAYETHKAPLLAIQDQSCSQL